MTARTITPPRIRAKYFFTPVLKSSKLVFSESSAALFRFDVPAMMATNMTSAKIKMIIPPINPPPIRDTIGVGELPAITRMGTNMYSAAIPIATGARYVTTKGGRKSRRFCFRISYDLFIRSNISKSYT